MRFLYTVGIQFYTLAIRIASLFGHHKAQLMVHGWRSSFPSLLAPLPTPTAPSTAWFHASSLGEFEQARPVLEAYRQRHPGCRVVVSFFSPSGYEVRKNYPLADTIIYLPPDTPRNARRLIDRIQPSVAFFVKYDFWYNYLGELHRRDIPTYLFSSIFRPAQYFFKPWGCWYRRQLRDCFTHLFVQNEESLRLLTSHGISHCSLAGDTRFDRVHQIATAAESDAAVEAFLNGFDGKVIVCGSTWPPDEQIIASLINHHSSLKIILAPHVISEEHLKQIETLFPHSIRYSHIKASKAPNVSNVLIIDNIGLLSKLYRYADIAYIGGGFGVGIHNILEAVTFGKPVFFGPNYHKFQEAHDIIARGGGWSISSEHDLLTGTFLQLITDSEAYRCASKACLDYMNDNLGSTDLIMNTIEA